MATKIKKTTLEREEVEKLTGTIKGARFTVVLDDIDHSDEWDPSILPIMEHDGVGKVQIVDGITEFIFRDQFGSTIQFTAKAGHLVVAKFFILHLVEFKEDDSTAESV